MGASHSCGVVQWQKEYAMAIHSNGAIQRFTRPLTAEMVMQGAPTEEKMVVCSSDSLYIGEEMVWLNDDEELEEGQLYFVVSLKKAKLKLGAREMAFYLRLANTAITKSRGRGKGHGMIVSNKWRLSPTSSSSKHMGSPYLNPGSRSYAKSSKVRQAPSSPKTYHPSSSFNSRSPKKSLATIDESYTFA